MHIPNLAPADDWLAQQPFLRRIWLNYRISLLLLLVAAPIAIVASLAFTKVGILAFALAFAALGLVLVVTLQNDTYLYYLAFLLCGYIFFSKGFAYVGFFPVYVSEIGIAVGVGTVCVLFFINRRNLRLRPLLKLEVAFLLVFLVSQLPATVPYFGEHGILVIRDAMQYLYAIYTLCIGILLPHSAVESLIRWYHKFFPLIVIWIPIFFLVARTMDVPIRFPGSPYSLLTSKGSDLAVHLGGAGAYLLLRLDRYQKQQWSQVLIWGLWLFISVAFVIVAIFGRASMLAALSAMGIAFIIRPSASWLRPVLIGSVFISVLLVTGWYSTAEIDLGIGRKISAEQFVLNISSIAGEGVNSDTHGHLEGTKQWRLNWWNDIINYTFFGDYFLTGKGYGISLADSDGYQVGEEGELRAPHNGHLTFLARGGVPGFFFWLLYVGASLLFLLRKIFSESTSIKDRHYATWFLAYSLAFHVAISFDVLMEGPMGGIWYWALQGIIFVYFSAEPENSRQQQVQHQRSA
jgi:hypothetical protein